MSRVPVWFERKFEFSFPVELYPNLLARLRGTPARLEEVLRGRSQGVRINKPQGKWSAQEHAGHLLDLETLWLTRVDDYVAGSAQLTVADLKNRKTDEANHNARPLEQILADFRAARDGTAEASGRTGCVAIYPSHSAPAFEDADAAGRSFVFCRRTRRSPSGANLGTAQRHRRVLIDDQGLTAIRGLVLAMTSPICTAGTLAALRDCISCAESSDATEISSPPAV